MTDQWTDEEFFSENERETGPLGPDGKAMLEPNSRTIRKRAPEGNVFVTIDDNMRVHISAGKHGEQIPSLAEALGRAITLYLRIGGDLEEMGKELIGISHTETNPLAFKESLSIPDAVGKVLREFAAGEYE